MQACCGGSWISIYFVYIQKYPACSIPFQSVWVHTGGQRGAGFLSPHEALQESVITHPLISGSLQHINRTSKILATTRLPPPPLHSDTNPQNMHKLYF